MGRRKKVVEVPAYFETHTPQGTAFVYFEAAVSNPEYRGCVTNKALAELENWCERYREFFSRAGETDALSVIRAIDRARRRIGDRWPTFPGEVLEDEQAEG